MASSDTPLRVCIVVPYNISERGGVKHHAFEVAHALRLRGDDVRIVGPATDDPKLEGVMSFGGVVNIRSNASDNRMALFVSPFKLRRYFREGRFDVVHVHEPPNPLAAVLDERSSPPGSPRNLHLPRVQRGPIPGYPLGQKVCQLLSRALLRPHPRRLGAGAPATPRTRGGEAVHHRPRTTACRPMCSCRAPSGRATTPRCASSSSAG